MSREAAIARKLRDRYPSERWALLRHVQSTPGARVQGVRIVDVVAVALWPSDHGRVELVEIKDSANDLRAEMEAPEKSAPFDGYASVKWIAVASPWQRVVIAGKGQIRPPWGLLSVGTGKPTVIVQAEEREPVERLSPFEVALLRAAQTSAEASAAGDAPMVEVSRPHLSRTHAGLACFHAVPSLAKTVPDKLPCPGCRDDRPTDPEAIEAAIRDADPDQLARYRALCAGRSVA